jgi:hypothetical protein
LQISGRLFKNPAMDTSPSAQAQRGSYADMAVTAFSDVARHGRRLGETTLRAAWSFARFMALLDPETAPPRPVKTRLENRR